MYAHKIKEKDIHKEATLTLLEAVAAFHDQDNKKMAGLLSAAEQKMAGLHKVTEGYGRLQRALKHFKTACQSLDNAEGNEEINGNLVLTSRGVNNSSDKARVEMWSGIMELKEEVSLLLYSKSRSI